MIATLALSLLLASPPELFKVRLQTTKGSIVLEVHPEWAPRGAQHFRELVDGNYYDGSRFFRVVPGKWAQFGIAGDPAKAQARRGETFPDEEPGAFQSNTRGMAGFAFAEPNGRGTQVYINLGDNSRLDAQGFVPFARVIEGMDVVESLYGEYGESSGGGIRAGKQDQLFSGGNKWLDEHFPKLDRLTFARVLNKPHKSPRDDR
jgi:peptidyl-prolyl cis-trans isomerase A (cyclophilin A)